jgi:hypothetical protein
LLLIVSLFGCSGSKEDKYDLLTKADRKTISEFCTCMEPFNDIYEKMLHAPDSVKSSQYADSMSIKYEEFSQCAEKIKPIEEKGDNKEYINQLFSYMKKKYPNCSKFILGERGESK